MTGPRSGGNAGHNSRTRKAAGRIYDVPGQLTEPRLRTALPERGRRRELRLGPATATCEHCHGHANAERVAAKT